MEDVEILPKEYRALCIYCLEPAMMEGKPSTFTMGYERDSAWLAGVIPLCEEHREMKNPIVAVYQRVADMYERLRANGMIVDDE